MATLENVSVEYLREILAEVDATEECWRQLNQALGNRLFDTLAELQNAALTALDNINSPSISMYLCL